MPSIPGDPIILIQTCTVHMMVYTQITAMYNASSLGVNTRLYTGVRQMWKNLQMQYQNCMLTLTLTGG